MKCKFESLASGHIYIAPLIRAGTLSISFSRFLQLALGADQIRPRVSNVDGHPAYPATIEELKQTGELGRNCRCRISPYINNVIEQDHRLVKTRVILGQWFRSVDGAMNSIRKGQIRWRPQATSSARCGLLSAHSISRRVLKFRRHEPPRQLFPHSFVCDTSRCGPTVRASGTHG